MWLLTSSMCLTLLLELCKVLLSQSTDTLVSFAAHSRVNGKDKIEHVYSDSYPSIMTSAKLLGASWGACPPGVHHNNAITKKCNHEVLGPVLLLPISLSLCCHCNEYHPCPDTLELL